MQTDSIPSDQKFSCKWNLSFFKSVPSNRLSFYLSSLLYMSSTLYIHFCLFRNAILHKILKSGFFFLKCSFHWLQQFLFLVLVFTLSWYFHLTISYLTLWKPNGLSKYLKRHQVIGLDLSTSAKLNG